MNQIASNTDLVTPVTDVMTSDAALEYEMKLVTQAIEQSLHNQVNVGRATQAAFAVNITPLVSLFTLVVSACCQLYVGLCVLYLLCNEISDVTDGATY